MIIPIENKYNISIAISRDFPESVELTENNNLATYGHKVIKIEVYKDRWRTPKDTVFLLEELARELKEKYLIK